MPVNTLLVEGELDATVLRAVLPAQILIEQGGSKGSLKPQARERRRAKSVDVCYVRDRDFDYDPPATYAAPVEDSRLSSPGGPVLGWRWCRHEMESYLLEPRLVEAATKWPESAYLQVLSDAARRIAEYTAARWAVGIARRSLPPFRELSSRPGDLTNEIKLPTDCSSESCARWAREHVAAFLARIQPTLSPEAVEKSLAEHKSKLGALTSAEDLLVWHAGKDLLAAMSPDLPRPYTGHPKVFLRDLQNWVRDSSPHALALFPEWQALATALKA